MRGPGAAGVALGRPNLPDLDALLDPNDRITVLTGAGLSTECGIPDFRSPGSPWLTHKPIPFQEFMTSAEARAEAWRRKFAIDDAHQGAKPGRGHRALVTFAEAGRLVAVVTQNIDGLHQAAGLAADRLVELHGNGTFAHCLSCGTRYELQDIRTSVEATGQAPVCGCGGFIKSATIAFGQSLKTEVIRSALQAAKTCDVFMAVGSSLVVNPAATLPRIAKQNGARLVIVNREPTPVDRDADTVIRADVGDVLESLASGL